jgi:hypothetical protein
VYKDAMARAFGSWRWTGLGGLGLFGLGLFGLLGLGSGCGGDGGPSEVDASDAPLDAGTSDAEVDAGRIVDAGDSGADADTHPDSGPDAGVDAGLDAGFDSGALDAAVDSGTCPPPSLDCTVSSEVVRGATVALEVDASSECSPVTLEWTLELVPDGSTAAIAEPDEAITSFVADTIGSYRVRLEATDARGGRASCEHEVIATFPEAACAGGDGDVSIERSIQPGLPRLSWSGEDYVFAFYGRTEVGGSMECSVGHLDPSGTPNGAVQRVSPDDGELSAWTRLARSDVGWGVVYVDDRGPQRAAYFARLDGEGALVAGSERLVSAPSHTVGAVTIAWNAADRKYGVVWTEGTRLHYRAVDDGGELETVPVDTLLGTGSFDYVGTPLVWANERFALVSTAPLRLFEFLRDGSVVRNSMLAAGGSRASIAFQANLDGASRYGIVWQDAGSVRFVRVDATGIVGSSLTLDAGPSAGEADVVWSGTDFGVTWNKGSVSVPSVVHFARVSSGGAVITNRALTTGAAHDWWPSLTFCGQYAVTYVRGIAPVNGEGELRLVFP